MAGGDDSLVDELMAKMDDLKSRLTDLERKQKDCHDEECRLIDRQKQDVESRLTALQKQVDEAARGVGEVGRGFGEVSKGVGEMLTKGLGEVQKTVGDVGKGVSEMAKGLADATSNFNAVKATWADTLAKVDAGLGEMEKKVTTTVTDKVGEKLAAIKIPESVKVDDAWKDAWKKDMQECVAKSVGEECTRLRAVVLANRPRVVVAPPPGGRRELGREREMAREPSRFVSRPGYEPPPRPRYEPYAPPPAASFRPRLRPTAPPPRREYGYEGPYEGGYGRYNPEVDEEDYPPPRAAPPRYEPGYDPRSRLAAPQPRRVPLRGPPPGEAGVEERRVAMERRRLAEERMRLEDERRRLGMRREYPAEAGDRRRPVEQERLAERRRLVEAARARRAARAAEEPAAEAGASESEAPADQPVTVELPEGEVVNCIYCDYALEPKDIEAGTCPACGGTFEAEVTEEATAEEAAPEASEQGEQ